MQARKWIVSKDYPTISNWCKQYDWDNAIPKKVLPKVGIMIIDKEPICAAGLFIDKTSKLSCMWGIFSNPKASKIKLYKAMKLCVDEIKKEAKKNKLSFVYSVTGENALHKLYNKNKDMMLCENNINSYIMSLSKNKNLDWISYKHG